MKQRFHEKQFDDGTMVKLDIFRRYVREWISSLLTRTRSGRQFAGLNVYDFFAGPGQDGAGSPGSPLIILEELKAFCQNRGELKADIPVRMVFSDKDADHIATLREAVEQVQCPRTCCRVEFSTASFADALEACLPAMRGRGQANLVLMDQFGVKEVTPEVVMSLLCCGATDVLFFISSSFIRRFIETEEIGSKFDLDPRTTKNVEYKAIHRYICDHFRSSLHGTGALVAPFSIRKRRQYLRRHFRHDAQARDGEVLEGLLDTRSDDRTGELQC